MSRKKLIDTEISALESELLGHIDDQIASLTALVGDVNWLAGSEVDNGAIKLKIESFARMVNDGVIATVLSEENVVGYVKKNHRDGYRQLKLECEKSGLKGDAFDWFLVSAVLNAECLYSKINFLNRLKLSGLVFLEESIENLCNPLSDGQLGEFKQICKQWFRKWDSIANGGGQYNALIPQQVRIMGLYENMANWIEQIASITDAKRANAVLFSSYKTKMSSFEKLREKLEKQ